MKVRMIIAAILALLFGLTASVWGAFTLRSVLMKQAESPVSEGAYSETSKDGPEAIISNASSDRLTENEQNNSEDVSRGISKLSPAPTDMLLVIFTGVLAFVAWRQMDITKAALTETTKAANAAKSAANTANAQATIMSDTLNQMKSDSGAQSSQFASQLAVVEKQAAATERASFANRAWISVQFLEIGAPENRLEKGTPDELAAINVRLLIQNDGLTPARINSIEASLFVVDSDFPNPTDYGVLKIDPDNPEHVKYNVGPYRSVSIADRAISAPVIDYQSGGGEIRQDVNIPGNGKGVPLEAEFVFPAPYSLLYRDPGENFPRYDYWLHLEIPYLDVYQVERRTCFFAHVDGKTAYWADHIPRERHNYQR